MVEPGREHEPTSGKVPLSTADAAYLRSVVRPARLPALALERAWWLPGGAFMIGLLLAALASRLPVFGFVLALALFIWTLALTLVLAILVPILSLLTLPAALRDRRRTLRDVESGVALRERGSFEVKSNRPNRSGRLETSRGWLVLTPGQLAALSPAITNTGGKQVFEGTIVRTSERPLLLAAYDVQGNALIRAATGTG